MSWPISPRTSPMRVSAAMIPSSPREMTAIISGADWLVENCRSRSTGHRRRADSKEILHAAPALQVRTREISICSDPAQAELQPEGNRKQAKGGGIEDNPQRRSRVAAVVFGE